MDTFKQTVLLFALASFGLIAAQVTMAKQSGETIEMKKLIYSIRKQTLNGLKKYSAPSQELRIKMQKAMSDFLTNWAKSNFAVNPNPFASVGFEVSSYKGNSETFALISENQDHLAGGGLYLLRQPKSKRCQVLMAPHGFFDLHTGRISVDAFFATKADALLLNSAHRYTGNRKAKIDKYGTDLAHRDDNFYFSVFEAMADGCSSGMFIQLHGYDQDAFFKGKSKKYDIILSAGDDVGKAVQWAKQATSVFKKNMPELKVATYGIEIGGSLGGETNVHKRYLHKKPGMLFLHVEMSTKLRKRLVENKDDATRFYKSLDQLLEMKK